MYCEQMKCECPVSCAKSDLLTADNIASSEWRYDLKINTHQQHDKYLECVVWWFKSATDEYWNSVQEDCPDIDVKEKSRMLYRWLKSHTEFKDRRKDLNLTLRVTWCGREQKEINKRKKFIELQNNSPKKIMVQL